MQNKKDQDDERICVRCKAFPGVQYYSFHCTKCHQEIQGNQGNPFFQSEAGLMKTNENKNKKRRKIRKINFGIMNLKTDIDLFKR